MISPFPWDNGIKPYWVNPKNGFEWYIDVDMTKYCSEEKLHDWPALNAICFYVCTNNSGNIRALSRVLVSRSTNEEMYSDTTMEGMATRIDQLRLIEYANQNPDT